MHISIPPRESAEPLPRLVHQLIQIGGSLSQMVAHMALSAASGRKGPDTPAIDVILAGLLEDVLEPLLDSYGEDTLACAADVVAAAHEQIGSEILLVPFDQEPDEDAPDWAATA